MITDNDIIEIKDYMRRIAEVLEQWMGVFNPSDGIGPDDGACVPEPPPCHWARHEHPAFTDTECGHTTMNYGLRGDIGWSFCMFCGRRIVDHNPYPTERKAQP